MIQFDQYFSDGLKPPSSKPPARSSLTNIRSLSNEGPRRQVQFGKLEKRAVQGRTIYFFCCVECCWDVLGVFCFNPFFRKMLGTASTFHWDLSFDFLIIFNCILSRRKLFLAANFRSANLIYIFMILPAHTDPGMQKKQIRYLTSRRKLQHTHQTSCIIQNRQMKGWIFFFD